ncbi:MAG: hypothetical protein PVTTEEND_001706, partial [Candidatus Fervidibacter sp.]
MTLTRRDVLKSLGAMGAGMLWSARRGRAQGELRMRDRPVEIVISPVSARTVRISVIPMDSDRPMPIP